MAWEKGRYYTYSQKIAGKTEKIYYGCSKQAHEIARIFEQKRDEKRRKRDEICRIRSEWAEIDQFLNALDELVRAVMNEVCTEAGYHKHHGEWRKRRVKRPSAESPVQDAEKGE